MSKLEDMLPFKQPINPSSPYGPAGFVEILKEGVVGTKLAVRLLPSRGGGPLVIKDRLSAERLAAVLRDVAPHLPLTEVPDFHKEHVAFCEALRERGKQ